MAHRTRQSQPCSLTRFRWWDVWPRGDRTAKASRGLHNPVVMRVAPAWWRPQAAPWKTPRQAIAANFASCAAAALHQAERVSADFYTYSASLPDRIEVDVYA
jgi:hypothetical protein